MWIIRIYVCFSIEPFHTVQDSGFQIVVNYQVVVCQLQIYRWYSHQLYTSRLVCMPCGLLWRYPKRSTSFSRSTDMKIIDVGAAVQGNDNSMTYMCVILV